LTPLSDIIYLNKLLTISLEFLVVMFKQSDS